MPLPSRRKFLSRAATALGLPLVSAPHTMPREEVRKVVVMGAHPDDPETGCGGLIALLTASGHRVTVVYLTRGEAGIPGTSHSDAAAIRTKEARAACELLNCDHTFLGQVDGATYINAEAYRKTAELLESLRPDLLLTHWPLDSHRDHRNCAQLAYDAWLTTGSTADLYYYEVVLGGQTHNFSPTHFVDIHSVVDTKHAACFIHRSQKIADVYDKDHGAMERWRGMQSGYPLAESFVRHWRSGGPLPTAPRS